MGLRIVAGEFGGRRLESPADSRVRPTADRVREAWFSILGGAVRDASVLDLFAGSGALGLEALSRGAARAHFAEINGPSLRALKSNITALGVEDRATVHRADALRYAAGLAPGAYDLALADPPYTADFAERLVALFRKVPFAGILAVEHRADRVVDGDEVRRWGDTAVTFVYPP